MESQENKIEQKTESQLEKRGRGREITYTDERADQICDLISTHSESILTLHEMYPDIVPCEETFWRWRRKFDYFAKEYAKAKRLQSDANVDSMIRIAKDCKESRDAINKAKLLIDVFKWDAAKRIPKLYGDRTISEVEQTVTVKSSEEARKMDSEEVESWYKDLMG